MLRNALLLASSAMVSLGFANTAAFAQSEQGAAARASDDIIVTARKRQESVLNVPVVVSVVSEEKLDNLQINQITDLPKLVPGLVIGGNILSIGPQVTVRGVGTSSSDPGVDQNVSLNVDGLSLGNGLAFASGMFDVAQVEVLKGPQALFYGKASPGGVVSIRTADPTDELEVVARAGYEFEAREYRGDLIVSGPLSDTLGARVATMYSKGDGFFRNRAVPIPSTGAKAPFDREPRPHNFIIRGTLLWEPADSFSARLKVNHAYNKGNDTELNQLSHCPDGPNEAYGFGSGAPGSPIPPAPNFLTPVDPIPFTGGDNCKLDREIRKVHVDPAFFPGVPNNGVPFMTTKQDYGTLELNYDLSPEIAMTATTAYYTLQSDSMVNPLTTAAGPLLVVVNDFSRREFTQELRLNSDFSGPLNFTVGGFYQDGQLYDRVGFIQNRAYGFLPAGGLDADRATTVNIKTHSLFGQLRYKLAEQLELAGGVRWTDEERTQKVFDFRANRDLTPTLPRRTVASDNLSPEATITYRPTEDLTVFGSYRKAYKSGSFKVAVPAVAGENNAFDDEQVEGYELGVKSRLLDRSLIANLAFYDYTYKGLQVGAIEPSIAGLPVIRTVNAGKARTYGVDLELAYRPRSIEGLSFNASLNWNRARYLKLNNIPCYSGQTVTQGCNQFFVPSANQAAPAPAGAVVVNGQHGFYKAQDMSGTPMIRAPRWAANFGFDYELPVSSDIRLQLSNNNQYSGKYTTGLAIGRPGNDNFQRSFLKVDASLALKGPEDRWEVALIGKNITNKITGSTCSSTNFAGGQALGGHITGGSISGPAGFGENQCYTDSGRSVWVRLTYRP